MNFLGVEVYSWNVVWTDGPDRVFLSIELDAVRGELGLLPVYLGLYVARRFVVRQSERS